MVEVGRHDALGALAWTVAWYARYEFSGRGSYTTVDGKKAFAVAVRAAISPLTPAVFGVVWFLLYGLNAAGSYVYWRNHAERSRYEWGLLLLLLNLVFNKAWGALFFDMGSPRAAMLDVVLTLASAATVLVFVAIDAHHVGWLAFGLFAPYVLWLLVASLLNARFLINGDSTSAPEEAAQEEYNKAEMTQPSFARYAVTSAHKRF